MTTNTIQKHPGRRDLVFFERTAASPDRHREVACDLNTFSLLLCFLEGIVLEDAAAWPQIFVGAFYLNQPRCISLAFWHRVSKSVGQPLHCPYGSAGMERKAAAPVPLFCHPHGHK